MADPAPPELIARRLLARRRALDRVQREVAERAGMRTERYARYERGEIPNPRLSTLVRLARGLDTTVAELVKGLACRRPWRGRTTATYTRRRERARPDGR